MSQTFSRFIPTAPLDAQESGATIHARGLRSALRVKHLIFSVLLLLCSALHAQQSTVLRPSVPATARVGATVSLGAVLTDAWTGNVPTTLMGVPVEISIGDRYSLTTTTFFTSSSGLASRNWRFPSPGRYRVIFTFRGGRGYREDVVTTFVTVS